MEITKELAQKVLTIVDQGLSKGLGNPTPGNMCVEAAVCYAMGLPHSDKPTCVGSAVRDFKIRLNDANWPSKEARAEGMRKLAIAQLGSESIDQKAFTDYVIAQTVKRLLPLTLRKAAETSIKHADQLKAAATKCEEVSNLSEALEATRFARKTASAADAAAYAYASAYAAAYASASAADASASAADASASAADALKYLQLGAQIGLEALIHCQSPGVAFLPLCDEVPA